MRVGLEDPVVPEAREEEAVERLGPGLTLLERGCACLIPLEAMDPLAHQHPVGAQVEVHLGHPDGRLVRPERPHPLLGLGLVPVVALGEQPLAHGAHDVGEVRAQHPLEHPGERARVGQVGRDGLPHPRVLHLHDDLAAVVAPGGVDLPDRGRGDRLLLEAGEVLVERAELLLDHGEHHLVRRWRVVGLEPAEHLLPDLGVLLGHDLLEVAHHLAELHRQALQLAEGAGELLGCEALLGADEPSSDPGGGPAEAPQAGDASLLHCTNQGLPQAAPPSCCTART